MKFNQKDVLKLHNIITTCAVGGIDAIVIQDGIVRGANESKSCAIISNYEVPAFPQKIGLSRISLLRNRLDLFIANSEMTLDVKETERGEISQIEAAAGKAKSQFRCTSAALIKAPQCIDDESAGLISVAADELKMILDAMKVMSAKRLALIVKREGNVTFEAVDASNDRFTVGIEKAIERLSDEDCDSVVHYYPVQVLSPLLRAASNPDGVSFSVGRSGTITIIVNNHEMFVLSQMEDEE